MALNRSHIPIIASFCLIGTIGFFLACKKQYSAPRRTETPLAFEPQAWASPDPTPTDAHNYKDVLANLEVERLALAARYQAASAAQQADIRAQARTLVTRFIYIEIFPSWYGTAWDFNGTTEVPQQGKIACGYFVSTVLRDAGWRVQRARLAQQASENIILSLTVLGKVIADEVFIEKWLLRKEIVTRTSV